jgi:predicted 3-demethylubiquinone-9 3-methyltransferase (glyoxalase superfamily)
MQEKADEAAAFYVGLLPDSRVDGVFRPDPAGPPLLVDFTLAGAPFQFLHGGPQMKLSDACSISVLAKDQAEIDRLWTALSEGGVEIQCGWLRDRFGVAWQIVPEALPKLMSSGSSEARGRVMAALRGMVKFDVAALEAAWRGEP